MIRFLSSTKTSLGATALTSAAGTLAKLAMITRSPICALLAADPFKEMTPEPRAPRITYVTKRSPLSMFQMCTCSFSNRPDASIKSSSIAHDPS